MGVRLRASVWVNEMVESKKGLVVWVKKTYLDGWYYKG